MTYPKAPPYHVWEQVEPALWQCRYCKGWFRGKNEPHREARAMSEEKVRSANQVPDNRGETK